MKTFKEFISEVNKVTIEKKRESKIKSKSISPNLELEKDEFDRYTNSKELRNKAKRSTVKTLSSSETRRLTNTDAPDIKPGAKGRRKVRRLAKEYGKDLNRVKSQIRKGTDEPSIIHKNELIAGNTRAMVRRSLGKPIKAAVVPDN